MRLELSWRLRGAPAGARPPATLASRPGRACSALPGDAQCLRPTGPAAQVWGIKAYQVKIYDGYWNKDVTFACGVPAGETAVKCPWGHERAELVPPKGTQYIVLAGGQCRRGGEG